MLVPHKCALSSSLLQAMCSDVSPCVCSQLISRRSASAHIIAFIAGPCILQQRDVLALLDRLQKTRLDIIMLASAAEVGSDTMQALQSVVDALNGRARSSASMEVSGSRRLADSPTSTVSGCQLSCSCSLSAAAGEADTMCSHAGCGSGSPAAEDSSERASRLLFIQPPQEGMELWQQLEPLMEKLEASHAHASQRSQLASAEPTPSADAQAQALSDLLAENRPNFAAQLAPSGSQGASLQGIGIAPSTTGANHARPQQLQVCLNDAVP